MRGVLVGLNPKRGPYSITTSRWTRRTTSGLLWYEYGVHCFHLIMRTRSYDEDGLEYSAFLRLREVQPSKVPQITIPNYDPKLGSISLCISLRSSADCPLLSGSTNAVPAFHVLVSITAATVANGTCMDDEEISPIPVSATVTGVVPIIMRRVSAPVAASSPPVVPTAMQTSPSPSVPAQAAVFSVLASPTLFVPMAVACPASSGTILVTSSLPGFSLAAPV